MFRGVSVLIGGPMARSPSAGIASYLEKSQGPMLRNIKAGMNGKCIADSLVNAIDRLVGRKAGKGGDG